VSYRPRARAVILSLSLLVGLVAGVGRAAAGNGVGLLRFLPEDTNVVIALDVASGRDSALFQKLSQDVLAAHQDLVERLRSLGVDPARDVRTVLFGAVGDSLDAGALGFKVLIAEGRFSYDAIDKGLPATVVRKQHGRDLYWVDGDSAGALVGARLFVSPADQMPRVLDVVRGKAGNASRSRKASALRASISATDTRQDVWAAVVLSAQSRRDVRTTGLELDAITVGATMRKDMQVEVRAMMASDKAAVAAAETIGQQLAQVGQGLSHMGLGGLIASLTIDPEGAVVVARATVTEADLKLLRDFIAPLSP